MSLFSTAISHIYSNLISDAKLSTRSHLLSPKFKNSKYILNTGKYHESLKYNRLQWELFIGKYTQA